MSNKLNLCICWYNLYSMLHNGSIPRRDKRFSLLRNVQTGSGADPASFSRYKGLFTALHSSVDTATRYWLNGPGIETRWGIFRTGPDRPWGLLSLLYNGYRVSFPGVKRPGRGVNHALPSSAEVKERIDLYRYSPSGPSWPILGRTLTLLNPIWLRVN
jgi:hypothetical protein